MTQETLRMRFMNWIAGVAFKVFLWAIGMTQDEYITSIELEGARGYLEAKEEVQE